MRIKGVFANESRQHAGLYWALLRVLLARGAALEATLEDYLWSCSEWRIKVCLDLLAPPGPGYRPLAWPVTCDHLRWWNMTPWPSLYNSYIGR